MIGFNVGQMVRILFLVVSIGVKSKSTLALKVEKYSLSLPEDLGKNCN